MNKYVYFLGISAVLFFSKMAVQGQNVPKPLQSASLISKGITFHDKQMYDSARVYFNQITRNDSLYGTACYEIALGYYEQKEYDSALVYIKKSVNSNEEGITEQARVLMGSIFDDAGMRDSALVCYQIALKTTPYNAKLLYDFGCTYFRMDSLDLAEQYLIQAIKINPTYYRATFMLGKLNEKMNRRIEAMLCYYTANLINPSAELTRVVELYLAGESDIEPLRKEYIPTSPSFEKIEEYINSKIAMTAKYKPVFKSQSAFARQGDLLFKYLEYDPKADNFYMNYYVPLFIHIRDKKLVETAMYVYFSGFNIENVQKWVKSNSSKIQKYYGAVKEEISRLSARGFVHPTRYDGMNYIFQDGVLISFGKYSDEKNKVRDGLWHFLEQNGSISATEVYKNGKLNGEYKSFNFNGQLTGISIYENGLKSGTGRLYHDNGQLQAEGTFENDKLHGKLTYYFLTGQKKSEENYKNGTVNGQYITYLKNGNIADSISFSNGKQNGIYCAMYPNGQISTQGHLVNDLVDGELVNYYPDGKISRQGTFAKNNPIGKWIDYHPNGVVSSIYFYNDKGNLSDTAQYFDANGIRTLVYVYTNNGKNSQQTYFRPDGSIYQKQEIKNDIPTKLEVFDKDDKVSGTTNISGNAETYVKYYNAFGNVSAEGIRKNGKQEGRWIYYGIFGNIERISYFKKGDRNGVDTLFFSNGKIKTISNYKEDKADGYGVSYNLAGKITIEGYCVNDEPEGYWLIYDNFGHLTQKAYYTENDPDQWQQYYYPNGNLKREMYYNNFLIREIINYDTTGKEYERVIIQDTACKIVEHYSNGKIMSEAYYIGRVLNGEVKRFFSNGQINYSINKILNKDYGTLELYNKDGKHIGTRELINDKLHGKVKEIYEDEWSEGKHYNGQAYDTVKWYNNENKLTESIPYMEDEKHGLASYYNENGELIYQLFYYKGAAIECISPKNNEHIKIENNQKITTYYANGAKSAEMTFLNGYRDGEYIKYYPNGKLILKGNYEVGESNGHYSKYHSNGNLREEGNYVYGDYDGVVKTYYSNGKLKSETSYVYGEKHSEQKQYNQQGALTKKTTYYYGEICE